MNAFAALHEIPLNDVKNDPNINATYKEWQKLKYSLTSSIAKHIIRVQLTDDHYKQAREVISRSTYTELAEMRRVFPSLRADLLSFEAWLAISGGINKVDTIKIAKSNDKISESKKARGKKHVEVDQSVDKLTKNKLKEEVNKTVRLISSHYKKGLIPEDEKNHRISKVRSMVLIYDVIVYRDSLKLKPSLKQPKEDEVSDECDDDDLVLSGDASDDGY